MRPELAHDALYEMVPAGAPVKDWQHNACRAGFFAAHSDGVSKSTPPFTNSMAGRGAFYTV